MSYSAEISQRNPTFFLCLLDQSGSMQRPFGADSSKKMCEGVADAVNHILHRLVMKCSRGKELLDRYYVGVIGYSTMVKPAFGGALQGKCQVKISEVGQNPLRVETRVRRTDDGAGGILEQKIHFPIWFDPFAGGQTKMREAFEMARELVADFVTTFPVCFPPIVINITDGQPTDGTPPQFPEVEAASKALREVASEDGNVLLFNAHISPENLATIEYPADESRLPDHFSRLLFRMSSILPPTMQEFARQSKLPVEQNGRGFVFQGKLASVIDMLDIGTRVATSAR